MPYTVKKRGGKYCVVKIADEQKPLGCHPTISAAQKQIAAIEANSKE